MQNASVNTAPSRPMRSMLGVFSSLLPASEDSSQRAPSPKKNTRLGRARIAGRPSAPGSSCGAIAAALVAAAPLRKVRRVCTDAPVVGARVTLSPLEQHALADRLARQREHRHRVLRVPRPLAGIAAV